ncbi:MAG TPA: phosphoribosylanthranilate isomerase [Armatimonadota bacterium]|nr:phosphoribosylanthranilate isomerase [Armatimonadota bacterium]
MIKVKICGITNIEDAMAAVEAGADALGFVFAESPRRISAKAALSILEKLPPFVATVGVFANQDVDEVFRVWKQTNLHFAQLHDVLGPTRELVSPAGGFGWYRVIHALRVKSAKDIRQAADGPSARVCAALLLDAHVEGLMGGTGQKFDWDLAVQAKLLGKPLILAGGLTPANVEEAVRKVRPYAVDVSTGVEASPGKKDHAKIKEFIQNVRKAA